MKNNCPFLKKIDECTHKDNNLGTHKSLNRCPYSNPNRCRWYNELLIEQKRFTMANNDLKNDLKLRGVVLE